MSTALWPSPSSVSSGSLSCSFRFQVPSGVRHFEGKFENLRGQSLFYFSLYPPSKCELRGVVLYLHGVGDHCRRVISLYERLCEEGFGVITYDFVNHGASGCDSHKTRGHVRSFRQLVEDTNAYITFAKNVIFPQTNYLAPPLLIAGSSFGSLVGLHVVLSCQHKFYAAFWASPTVGMEMKTIWKVQAAVIQPLALFLPRMRLVPSVDYELLWRDPGTLADFKTDPLATKDDITARTMQQTLHAMHRIMKDKSILHAGSSFCNLSVLFLVGSEDHVADQGVTRRFYDKIANPDKKFRVFDGVFHSVFEDPESEEIFDYLCEWLRDRFPQMHTNEN
ncbi:serine protease family [Plasmopara halstedii]|uniref:Serine protease family n=1 Tax=Plasmopara halstedii TaxID=4781 RepID=A0A0P1AQ33_PLAHL|nr:serine protease family [Plasmopara halstedii]CEG42913.1 serine protease family [Plasmopara halstedii]|eukprot:XP_024579282.1 serine protease family [Plasmopara halstedii]